MALLVVYTTYPDYLTIWTPVFTPFLGMFGGIDYFNGKVQ
jgi:hypothetical protein